MQKAHQTMDAMVLHAPKTELQLEQVAVPEPGEHEVLLRVKACACCRTDLHVWAGELTHPALPLILGHQVVGEVVKLGDKCSRFKLGDRLGAPWLGKSCTECDYCRHGQENLCNKALYRGYQFNGGFAEYCLGHEDYLFPIPESYEDAAAAPLLCAGLIGYRCLRLVGEGKKIGFYGFGVSAHILIQILNFQKRQVYAFVRPGDEQAKAFATKLGATWAGDSTQKPPEELDGAIVFASDGKLVPKALQDIKKGGSIVCAGIYMSDIPSFPYDWLYGERIIRSVTNLTRQDGEEFFDLARKVYIKTAFTTYPLKEANQALKDQREGKLSGAAVLIP